MQRASGGLSCTTTSFELGIGSLTSDPPIRAKVEHLRFEIGEHSNPPFQVLICQMQGHTKEGEPSIDCNKFDGD
jgi:hypothetical protein